MMSDLWVGWGSSTIGCWFLKLFLRMLLHSVPNREKRWSAWQYYWQFAFAGASFSSIGGSNYPRKIGNISKRTFHPLSGKEVHRFVLCILILSRLRKFSCFRIIVVLSRPNRVSRFDFLCLVRYFFHQQSRNESEVHWFLAILPKMSTSSWVSTLFIARFY